VNDIGADTPQLKAWLKVAALRPDANGAAFSFEYSHSEDDPDKPDMLLVEGRGGEERRGEGR
jgi:hypothetical protein